MSTAPTIDRDEEREELHELAARIITHRHFAYADVFALAHGVRELLEERQTAVALTEDHWMSLLVELRDELHEVARNSASSHVVAAMQVHLTGVDERATRAAVAVERLERVVLDMGAVFRARRALRRRLP